MNNWANGLTHFSGWREKAYIRGKEIGRQKKQEKSVQSSRVRRTSQPATDNSGVDKKKRFQGN